MHMTMPQERVREFLSDLIDDLVRPKPDRVPKKLILVVVPFSREADFILHELWILCQNHDKAEDFRIDSFRRAVVVTTSIGDKTAILFTEWNRPESLHGMRPDQVILMGSFGEFFMCLLSSGAEISAVG